ncbi:Biopolymer transport protein ExbD/TolR [Leptothrix cholodnii SP-6]|uniref:Biopolymer transport protein ExbD/TolR n=1 Tax=Leptothrix cholodnii (strain ATCC 51168 / LMG 8142 / SP-6) TaxID=395495 RepID=B1Y1A7_LEPCP|nr:biopolymer transporter ExbD [Leptothrix cholodnii]ACB33084.1 Biopolymer transport protein ExbD/TolR [Leptothrix cholodnii SP-6]
MAMNIGSHQSGELEVIADMNTTPLIDVMLVLLIMLIITIPAQLHAVNLDIPLPTNAPKTVEPFVVRIDVDESSVISWNGEPLPDRNALELKLSESARMQPQPELHIRSKGKAKYEAVATVLASAQRNGLNKLGIVGTEQFAN